MLIGSVILYEKVESKFAVAKFNFASAFFYFAEAEEERRPFPQFLTLSFVIQSEAKDLGNIKRGFTGIFLSVV